MKRALAPLLIAVGLVACGSARPPAGTARSGIRGVVLAAPGCAVESMESPCPERAVRAEVVVREPGANGDPLATATTDEDGRFRIALRPGTYAVTARPIGGHPGSAGSAVVRVPEQSFTEVTLRIDIGIRPPETAPS